MESAEDGPTFWIALLKTSFPKQILLLIENRIEKREERESEKKGGKKYITKTIAFKETKSIMASTLISNECSKW